MKTIFKTIFNSTLLVLFLAIMIAPISFMSFINLDEKPQVLSATDSKEDVTFQKPVPKDVEDYIQKMEKEFYESTSSQPAEK